MTDHPEKLVLPHKMNSFLKTGTRYGPNAHGTPIREINGHQHDKRPRVTLPYVPAPSPETFVPPQTKARRKHVTK